MGDFSATWLALREPCDSRSRSEELVRVIRDLLPERPLHAIDLGAGTGSNVRYLAPRLGGEQSWLAIDQDFTLLEHQPKLLQGPGFTCQLSAKVFDLASDVDALPLVSCPLVSASALLDLVSAQWLERLAKRCRSEGVIVLFALSYDGRIECSPPEVDDAWICDLLNQHQLRDKGFGAALGPEATSYARTVFERQGFDTVALPSDWMIEPDEQELQLELMAGWIATAQELAPNEVPRIVDWAGRRMAHLAAGVSRLRVGHQDFIAYPALRRSQSKSTSAPIM